MALSGQLELFEDNFTPAPGITLRLYNGHTEGMAVPFIQYDGMTLIYSTDLFPTMAHIPASWICGFDIRPLISLKEHDEFLNEALLNDYILIFEHDIHVECCRLEMTKKGIRGTQPAKLTTVL
jgi:hypothetical protein